MIANKGPWIAQHLFRPPRNELLGRRLGLAKFSTSRVPINAPKFRPHHRTGSLVQPICWRPRTPASVDLQLRYNSSVSNTTPSPSVISDNFATTPLEDAATLTAADITSLPERIGYLKELGLDYGWGPTSVIQWLLEHVHIWTGMPWWASILVTVTLLRAGTFKFTIDAADNGSRVQALKNVIQPIRERMSAASKSSDRDVAMQARAELQNIHARAGISTWKSFLPLINIPIGFGCFRLMRGMATLPVPGLETGGFLWVTDLTYGDPIYILPVVNGLLLFVTSKVAFSQAGGNIHPSLEKFMVYGLPGVTTLISLQWAACLQLSMIALAFWTSLFSGLLRSNRFRKWVGIVPAVMPEHTAGKNKGWVDQMKDGYQVAKSKAKVSQNSRGKQAELYEERRRREIEAEFERKRRR